ncbi:S9 family peptidase [Microaceticoccus formicicus]|uniref:S9 family peptidase n=1 Tax=Microaceticoccus formicicus TaxID=3118105 RepID=UPI003CD03149|nr:S9 family peptidase [Peptoniphilaceae bacterium AMB_02]
MKKINIDTLNEFRFLSGLKISQDEMNLAFKVSRTDEESNTYKSCIHLLNTEDDSIIKLTSENLTGPFDFLNDSNIIFASDRGSSENKKSDDSKKEKHTKFYSINIGGGEASLYMDIPKDVVDFTPIDESKFLIQYNYVPFVEDDSIDSDDYLVFDEFPYRFNGKGYINKKRTRLAVYDRDKSEVIDITDELTNVSFVKLNKSKTKALFTSNRYTTRFSFKSDLMELDLSTNKTDLLLKDIEGLCNPDYFGDKIVFQSRDRSVYGLNTNPGIYFYENGEVRLMTPSFDSNFGNSLGTDLRLGSNDDPIVYNDKLYFLSTDNDVINMYHMDLSGNIVKVTNSNGSIDDFIVVSKGIYTIYMDENSPQEIHLFNDGFKKLSDYNGFLKDYEISKVETFEFSNDGIDFYGYVIPPIAKKDKNPAILSIHGGPKTVFGKVLHHEMQLLASLGYYVFYMNPRGSCGRGNEFMDIRGKYGSIDYEDLMKFTDEVLTKYDDIDSERLGVMGGSYGGFMTNWIIGHTDRFKRACTQRCISNWISMYGTSDIGFYFVEDQVDGTPWRDFENMWNMSPLKYADRITTPTLIIHADEDHRCPPEQGHQMFLALNYHDIETKMVVFKGENHELSRSGKPLHRRRRLNEIVEWMTKI